MLRNMTSVYIINDNKILLLYRIGSKVVQPSWCGIGGHFEKDELNDPKACALRELFEETGIRESDIEKLELRYITLRKKNDEIRQNYYYFAKLHNTAVDISTCNEGILEWIDIDQVLNKIMPFSAKECLKHYLFLGKNDNNLYAGIATSNGVDFKVLQEFS